MRKLSYLDNLLDGDSVEWISLGKIAEYSNTRVDAIKLDATSFTGVDNLVSNKGGRIDANYLPNTARLTAYEPGDILLGNIRPYLKKVWMATDSGGCSGDVLAVSIRHECRSFVNPKFLYFILSSDAFFFYSMQHAKGAKMPRGSKADILNYEIPIPCPNNPEKSLAIQSEIVRILDTFTSLTAELTAELTMRKKQYNYYRDQLLSFDEGEVQHIPMGDQRIGVLIRGGSFQKKDFTESGMGCIHYGQIYTHYGTYADKTKTSISAELAKKCRKAHPGNLIIATTSENDEDVCKAVAWVGNDEIAVSSDACIYRHNLNPKYVSYFFQTEQFQSQKRQYITGAKVRRVNANNLAKILIPVPSIEEQERIVSILDKFDTLTSSITDGLPREIGLRQKQYEHYRDLLFSFPKPETVSN